MKERVSGYKRAGRREEYMCWNKTLRISAADQVLTVVFIQTILFQEHCFSAHCSLVSTTASQNKRPGLQPGQLGSFCGEFTCSPIPMGFLLLSKDMQVK